jgi:predicted Zn-dependent protease
VQIPDLPTHPSATLSRYSLSANKPIRTFKHCSLRSVVEEAISSILPELGKPVATDSHAELLHYKGNLSVLLYPSNIPNAHAVSLYDTPQILLSSELLSILSSPEELAYVMAHEFSHIRNKHYLYLSNIVLTERQIKRLDEIKKRWELQADLDAQRAMVSAGIPLHAAARVLRKITARPNHHASHIHLPREERIAMLENRNKKLR